MSGTSGRIARVTQSFEAGVAYVSAARRFVMSTVAEWGLDAADAGLVVSELAANALVHAESPFTVSVFLEEDRLVIEVTDHGPGSIAQTDDSRIGLGLTIVDRLSTWGVRRHLQGGKTVWAKLNQGFAESEQRG